MENGYKLEDKCLRNELLILINYLISTNESIIYFYESSHMPNVDNTGSFIGKIL